MKFAIFLTASLSWGVVCGVKRAPDWQWCTGFTTILIVMGFA